MPVDPSGVTTDDHGEGGGGPEGIPEDAPAAGSGPVADPRAGLPPLAGSSPAGGNGSNGHDEAGLPPTGGAIAAEGEADQRRGGGTWAVDTPADQDAAQPSWAAPTAVAPDAAELRHGEGDQRVPGGGDGGPQRDEVAPSWPTAPPASAPPVADPAAAPAAAIADEAGWPAVADRGPGLRARRRARKPKARRGLRVRQRLWSIDPWSTFKLSVLFYICLCGIILVAGTLLWNVGRSVGTIDDIESFVTRMGAYGTCTLKAEVPAGTPFEEDDDCAEGEVLVGGYTFDDATIFRIAGIGGGILVVAGSLGNVLLVVLVNLLNELTGGLRYTVIKEPLPRPQAARQRGPRFAGARAIARRSGPRHAMAREGPAPPPPNAGSAGDERLPVPAAELSTDTGPQR